MKKRPLRGRGSRFRFQEMLLGIDFKTCPDAVRNVAEPTKNVFSENNKYSKNVVIIQRNKYRLFAATTI